MSSDVATIFAELLRIVEYLRTPLLFLVSLFLGAGGGWLIAGIPFRDHLLDHPNDRSSHEVPTPRGGGVGILAAFILAGISLRIPTHFLFAGILVSCISLYGDFFRISVRFRLAVQFVSAIILISPIIVLKGSSFASVSLPVFFVGVLLLVLFVVATTNFYNFMDGINGIAGLSGAIAFGLLGLYTLYAFPPNGSSNEFSLLAICVALACLGFLPFNMPRARVFVGDVGSILLGFVFASLVIVLSRNYREMICLAAILFPFYADELTTMFVRIKAGENLTRPHRSHL